MSRDALVVGINSYSYKHLNSLAAPAQDAEAVAQLLEKYGDFKVTRLPAVKDKQNETIKVGKKTKVTLTQLEEAIVQLFKPDGTVPDTALLYFSGHGLRKDKGIQEGFLATSNVNPDIGFYGLSLQWLRRLLQESEVKQQIIILDCCYSGELLNFTEADPGDRGQGRDRCFIAASRPFEVAYEEIDNQHSVFTTALLKGLEPLQDRWVTNYTLVEKLNQKHHSFPQRPIFSNSGEPINLTRRWTAAVKNSTALRQAICPYKGLRCFDCIEEDAKYFYGRTALIDELLDKVRQGNFLAVLGASGSGKSSVVRAGLLYQLKLGRRLSGSENWLIKIFKPGENPLQSLALAFLDTELSGIEGASQLAKAEELIATGADGLRRLVTSFVTDDTQRLVLFIDQFEEAFALCKDNEERQKFFECLLGALHQCGNKLCLVLTMRSDFFGKCTEQKYSGLAQQIQKNLVTLTPMTREELEQAIVKPAKQVELEIEPELVEEILADVANAPLILPLLQDTLTELWKKRPDNCLQLKTYSQLGRVMATLRQRAQAVYESFDKEEQATCKHIFLALTQLPEGTEYYTCRRCFKQDLVSTLYSEELIDKVVQRLTDEELIVTNEMVAAGSTSERVVVVNVAHEALIRHWSTLRWWLKENARKLGLQRQIEQAAQMWKNNGKQADFLLKGVRLEAAEEIYIKYTDELSLDVLDFIAACLDERLRQQWEQKKRLRRARTVAAVISVLGIAATGFGSLAYFKQQDAQTREIEALNASSEALMSSHQQLEALIASLQAGKQLKGLFAASPDIKLTTLTTLQQAVSQTHEINRLQEHSQKVNAVSFSPDGSLIASVGNDKNLIIWERNGELDKTITSEERLTAVTFSPDSKSIAVGSADKTLKLYSTEGSAKGKLIKTFTQHQDWVTSVIFSPGGKIIASASRDGNIKLWDIDDGNLIRTWKAHDGWVNTVRFSPDDKTIVSGGEDNLIKLWRSDDGTLLKPPLKGHQGRITQIKFSLDGKFIVSASGDQSVKIWNTLGNLVDTFSNGYDDQINSISINSKNNLLAIAHPRGIDIRSFDPTSKDSKVLQTLPNNGPEITDISFSPDDKVIASASNDKSVRLWQIKIITPQHQQGESINSVAANPRKSSEISFAAAGWDGKIYLRRQDGSLFQFQTLPGHKKPVTAVNFSPNGKFLASASNDQTIKLWNLENYTFRIFKGHKDSVDSISFSPNGKLLVSGSTDKTVKLWNQDGKFKTFPEPTDTVSSVTFSPDGKMIAAGAYDNQIYLWKLDGSLLRKFKGHKLAIASVKFSADGNTLASASWDNTINLWNVKDGKLIKTLTGHTKGVKSISFTANDKLLVSGSKDGTIKLWNLESGKLLKTLKLLKRPGHILEINSLTLTRDSQTLVIGSENAGVRVWSLDLDKLMEQGCSMVKDYLRNNPNVSPVSAEVCN